MTSDDIPEFNEAKELIKAGRYEDALAKLEPLAASYPQDQQIQRLIDYCQSDQKVPPQSKLNNFSPTGFQSPISGFLARKKKGPK